VVDDAVKAKGVLTLRPSNLRRFPADGAVLGRLLWGRGPETLVDGDGFQACRLCEGGCCSYFLPRGGERWESGWSSIRWNLWGRHRWQSEHTLVGVLAFGAGLVMNVWVLLGMPVISTIVDRPGLRGSWMGCFPDP